MQVAADPKPFVLVRTYSAGVHCGTLEQREGREVSLSDVRRIWRWRGANTLNDRRRSRSRSRSRRRSRHSMISMHSVNTFLGTGCRRVRALHDSGHGLFDAQAGDRVGGALGAEFGVKEG